MIANILQLAAGMLLAISSFIVNMKFQIPVLGEKLPGTFERLRQMWAIRIGLLLLVLGYSLPIANWDIELVDGSMKILRIAIGFGSSLTLVVVGYLIAGLLAKRDYKKTPVLTENNVGEGTFFFTVMGDEESRRV